jgi:prepilin-type N-terminal cleavage/methylation domain-containing protein
MTYSSTQRGFTLIELLVVIAIIALLSSLIMAAVNDAREKSRDTRRLSDMRQIQLALEMYYDDHNEYPVHNSSNGDWEGSSEDDGEFLDVLVADGYLSSYVVDPINSGTTMEYCYYRYGSTSGGCDAIREGGFVVLGVRNMESSGRPHPASPGWSCPTRNWQNEFDWVVGLWRR